MQQTETLKEDFNLAKMKLRDLAEANDNYSEEQRCALNYLEGIFTELSTNLHADAADAEWEGFRPQLTKFFTKLENEAKILDPLKNSDLKESFRG